LKDAAAIQGYQFDSAAAEHTHAYLMPAVNCSQKLVLEFEKLFELGA